MREEENGRREKAAVGPRERDCISVIMWAGGRLGCGFLINFANFSINATARRFPRKEGQKRKKEKKREREKGDKGRGLLGGGR